MSVVDVAAAVLVAPDGRVLLAQRPEGKVYAGYWEFPGGKVERGESLRGALARELEEELGVHAKRVYPWLTQSFVYPHAHVRLHFFRVLSWCGELHGREGQAFAWCDPERMEVAPMLPANTSVMAALRLPAEYAISNAEVVGERAFLEALERRLAQGLRLVQLRDRTLARHARERLARAALERTRTSGARLLVNGDEALAKRIDADGVHYPSAQLARLATRPDFALCAASCHNEEELAQTQALGLDFVVLGPVRATASHPGAAPIGWMRLAQLVAGASIPVFALGGLTRSDLEMAWEHGAHGVAMIRGAWNARLGDHLPEISGDDGE
jgi:8-oxo-dGTP diphosphatase